MLEALRGLGYSTPGALADLIDNSIAAQAREVRIHFRWAGNESTTVSILDDGEGMTPQQLDQAMRLGEKSPLDWRRPDDLGRFGLGLKTASFSQCRRLTVASKRGGETSCLRWDLDVLANSAGDGWYLMEGPAQESADLLAPLEGMSTGTLVLWEGLDRVVTPGFTEQDFLDLIDRVELHLGMVFHRFLEKTASPLQILINNRTVPPWNPFLPHVATWSSPLERLPGRCGEVLVQCHVLPHKDHLEPRQYERAGGPEGWTGQQGFYVYRSQRMLVAGSWLGLGPGRRWTKEEAYRLARIRLDITNSADADWKIDIRKSTAKPPVSVRARLTRLAEDTRDRARRVFAHRGIPLGPRGGGPVTPAWRADRTAGGVRYRIDREHPAVRAVLADAGPLLQDVRAMLSVIEETVPVQRIWLDTTEGREVPRAGFFGAPARKVTQVLMVMYRNLLTKKAMMPDVARDLLLRTEPFNNYPELVAELPDVLEP